MYIIAGLGNPGKKYENTRHNLGFIVLDQLAKELGVKIDKSKFKSLICETKIGDEKVILVKPQTFMNNSGEALREIVNFYKIDPENLMVIYDDVDIPLGRIRIRQGGSAGSHNGMRSILYHLEFENFPRIRVGIGKDDRGELMDYVLSGFKKDEVEPLEKACLRARDAAISYVKEGIDMSMNRFNKQDE